MVTTTASRPPTAPPTAPPGLAAGEAVGRRSLARGGVGGLGRSGSPPPQLLTWEPSLRQVWVSGAKPGAAALPWDPFPPPASLPLAACRPHNPAQPRALPGLPASPAPALTRAHRAMSMPSGTLRPRRAASAAPAAVGPLMVRCRAAPFRVPGLPARSGKPGVEQQGSPARAYHGSARRLLPHRRRRLPGPLHFAAPPAGLLCFDRRAPRVPPLIPPCSSSRQQRRGCERRPVRPVQAPGAHSVQGQLGRGKSCGCVQGPGWEPAQAQPRSKQWPRPRCLPGGILFARPSAAALLTRTRTHAGPAGAAPLIDPPQRCSRAAGCWSTSRTCQSLRPTGGQLGPSILAVSCYL
jgi:hypothetical protein